MRPTYPVWVSISFVHRERTIQTTLRNIKIVKGKINKWPKSIVKNTLFVIQHKTQIKPVKSPITPKGRQVFLGWGIPTTIKERLLPITHQEKKREKIKPLVGAIGQAQKKPQKKCGGYKIEGRDPQNTLGKINIPSASLDLFSLICVIFSKNLCVDTFYIIHRFLALFSFNF